MRRTKFARGTWFLGMINNWFIRPAIFIGNGYRFQADHACLTLEKVLIPLVGQVGRIAVFVSIIAFHRLAEKAVLAGVYTNLNRRK